MFFWAAFHVNLPSQATIPLCTANRCNGTETLRGQIAACRHAVHASPCSL